MKRLTAKPRRTRKSIILTMKYTLYIHEEDNEEAKRIGKMFKAWMRDVFSNWDDSILQNFMYDCHIEQNEEDDRITLEGHMDKILKDDCEHQEERAIEEDNLLNYNKDTSSSETTTKKRLPD